MSIAYLEIQLDYLYREYFERVEKIHKTQAKLWDIQSKMNQMERKIADLKKENRGADTDFVGH